MFLGPHTSLQNVITLLYIAAPGDAPTNVMSSSITSTSVTLSWLPPRTPNGNVRHYIVIAIETNTGANFTYQAQSHSAFSIGDLHPYYTYLFNVFAVTVEVGPPSFNHTVTTLQDSMLLQ